MDTIWEFITASNNTLFLASALLFLLLVGVQLLGFLPDFDIGDVDLDLDTDLDVDLHVDVDVDMDVDIDATPELDSTASDITKCPTAIYMTTFLLMFTLVGYIVSYLMVTRADQLTPTQQFAASVALAAIISFSTSKRIGLFFARLFPDVASYEMKDIVGRMGVVRSGTLSCNSTGMVDLRDEKGSFIKVHARLADNEEEASKGTPVRVIQKVGNCYLCTSHIESGQA